MLDRARVLGIHGMGTPAAGEQIRGAEKLWAPGQPPAGTWKSGSLEVWKSGSLEVWKSELGDKWTVTSLDLGC